MIRTACIIVFYLLITQLSVAQPSIQWQKAFGGSSYDDPYDIVQISSGGYLVVGTTASNDGDIFGDYGSLDYWILKLNEQGSVLWKKLLGGSLNDIPRSVAETQDGGFIVAGYSNSSDIDVIGNHGGSIDGWIVKLNKFGMKEWTKAIGGSKWDEIHSVKTTSDNGCIVVGKTDSNNGDVSISNGKLDVWVVKLDAQGEIEWEKSYGGSEDDESSSVIICSDGGYLVVGETSSIDGDVIGQHGSVDFWVLKLRPNGDMEWQKTLGGTGGDYGSDGLETTNGDYVITGYVGSHNSGDVTGHDQLGSFDYWIVRLDKDGDIKWQKTAGGSSADWARQIVQSPQGGFIVTGTTISLDGDVINNVEVPNFWLIKLSEEGELLWQKTYGGSMSDRSYAISNTNDSGYILAGYTWSTDGDAAGANYHGYSDFWIVKLSPENTSPTQTPETETLKLYPNPCGASVLLEIPEADELEIILTDISGKTLLAKKMSGAQEQLNLANLPRGVYLLRVGKWAEVVYKTE
ncbi:MAG: T9SS type A sorting domain-containing protein [Saprospiraceae bacterium]|nr:T9SS type A sorting domain-containing protein [Saprospiraceae bacterium]